MSPIPYLIVIALFTGVGALLLAAGRRELATPGLPRLARLHALGTVLFGVFCAAAAALLIVGPVLLVALVAVASGWTAIMLAAIAAAGRFARRMGDRYSSSC